MSIVMLADVVVLDFVFKSVSQDGNHNKHRLQGFRFKHMDRLQPNKSSGFFFFNEQEKI